MSAHPVNPSLGGSASTTHASERYRGFSDVARFPLGQDLELVYSPLTRRPQTLNSSSVRLLQGCDIFATLDDHAERLGREINLGAEKRQWIRAELSRLAAAGLLVSRGDLVSLCRQRSDSPIVPARIASVGIPTRNRTESLHGCLRSHIESSQRHGRAHDFVVVDDSEKLETRQANRHMLQTLTASGAVPLFYAGPEDKARYAEALIRQAGLPAGAVNFALLNGHKCPIATGTSRNALLLQAAGDALLQVDDDTVCHLAPAPRAQSGLAFCSQYDPTQFWFLTDGEPALGADAPSGEDLLAAHERLLGRSIGESISEISSEANLDFDRAGAGFFRKMQTRAGKVLVTAAGWAGDSGMGSSVYFLSLDGDSRARLLRSEQDYRSAITRHQVLRAVTCPTISDGAFCMAVNLGLDNRQLLPPFMPVQRNQDGIFAALVRSCFEGDFFGFLPWVLQHRSPVPRRFSAEDLWKNVARVQSGQIVQALVNAFAPGPDKSDSTKNLRALGRSLAEWGSVPLADFEELVRLVLWNQMSRQVVEWENLLRRFQGQPAFWANDVKQLIATVQENLTRDDYAVPWDLREAFGIDAARILLQRLVGKFGQLLQVWPDMMEASKDLRRSGLRLADKI